MRPEFQSIDHLLTHSDLFSVDSAIAAAVVQNCCVRTVGAVETTIRSLLHSHSVRRSSPQVASFVYRQLQGFYNPKFTKIEELLRQFSDSWGNDFAKFAIPEIRDALNSLVSNKNLIAHSRPSGIGVATLRPWVKRAIETCDFIDQLVA